MIRLLFIIIVTFVVFLLSMSGCNKENNNTSGPISDKTELEGTWIGYEVGRSTGTWTFTMTGNQISISGRNGAEWYKGTVTMHQGTTPKQADIKVTECAEFEYVGKTTLFIYKIQNNTATFAGNEPGATVRPTAFTTNQARVFVLTKQ